MINAGDFTETMINKYSIFIHVHIIIIKSISSCLGTRDSINNMSPFSPVLRQRQRRLHPQSGCRRSLVKPSPRWASSSSLSANLSHHHHSLQVVLISSYQMSEVCQYTSLYYLRQSCF